MSNANTSLSTDQLIQRLADSAIPRKPLRVSWQRTAIWLGLSLPYVALVVLMMSPRADIAQKTDDFRYLIEQGGALITAIFTAYAAFSSTIPGQSKRALMLPLIPLSMWLASLVQGCWLAFVEKGLSGISFQLDLICLPAIALAGTFPAIIIVIMIRRGAPLVPHLTVALAALAAAALGNFGLRLFHTQDASLMVLVWQFGTVVGLTAIAGMMASRIFSWGNLANDSDK